jgi:hypothetical protein
VPLWFSLLVLRLLTHKLEEEEEEEEEEKQVESSQRARL